VRQSKTLHLAGRRDIAFDEATDLLWKGRERLPQHPNALKFTAFDATGAVLAERTYFSIGGGFVRDEEEMGLNRPPEAGALVTVPYPFDSGEELLALASKAGLTIAELMRATSARAAPTPRSTPASMRSPRPCTPASTAACARTASCPAA